MNGTRCRHGRYGRCRDCLRHDAITSGAIRPGRPGRPRLPDQTLAKVAELAGLGKTHSQIARETGISRRSVIRILTPCAKSPGGAETGTEVSEHG